MSKNLILKSLSCIIVINFSVIADAYSQKVKITTKPATAQIIENGRPVGTGIYTLKVPKKGATYTIDVEAPGYISQRRVFQSGGSFSTTQFFDLVADPLYTSTTQSNWLNKDNTLNVKEGRTTDEAWKIIVSTILDKFDVLDANDGKLGYLRTSWVGTNYNTNTIRVRVIVKMSTEDPLVYKLKFVSEASGSYGTPYNADNLYQPYERIEKKYDGFLEELMTKLRN